jgi:hypothetical protein
MSLPDDSAPDMFATGSDGNANQSRSGFVELGRRRDQSNFRLHGTITGPPHPIERFSKVYNLWKSTCQVWPIYF